MKKIVIMPGGFHPFHAGHYALYQSAKKAFPDADMYVAASDSRTERPFPFQIKQKLAQVAGVKPNEFVQVKSPFRSEEITAKYNPDEDALIFVRSEKDKNEQPIPGGTKKDGTPSYFQPYNPKDVKPFKQHGYITYLPTVEFAGGIKSATEIRKQWPHLNDRQKANMIQTLYPETTGNKKLIKNVVGLMDAGMGMLTEGEVINVDFSQRQKAKSKNDWQQVHPEILTLANHWFWTTEEMGSSEAVRNKEHRGELEQQLEDITAILGLNGYSIDYDNSMDNIILTYKDDTKYKLPTDDAYDFSGWAKGTNLNEAWSQKYKDSINCSNPKGFSQKAHCAGKKKRQTNENFVEPQFDVEWNEANRYPFLNKLGKDAWIELAKTGKAVTVSADTVKKIGNTGADGSETLDTLDPDKVKRFRDAVKSGKIEMPIIMKMPNGKVELIAGNTRLTGLIAANKVARVWLIDASRLTEGPVVDLINPIDAEFINWLKDKPNLKLDMFSKDRKQFLRKLRLQYEKETGRKLPVNEGDVVQFKPREDKEIDLDTKLDLAMYIVHMNKPEGNIIKNSLKQRGLRFAVDNEQDPETVIIRFPDGKTGRVKVDELREILLFHVYQHGAGNDDIDEDRYWNVGDGNNDPIGEPQQQPSEELRLKKTHNRAGAFVESIRRMIGSTTNEEKEKTLHLHRKAFELMEEEKNNVIKLRGFGPKEKESDKKVVDLQKVRQEKEQEQEKRNDLYDKKRKSQEHYMHVIQQILFNLHEEMAEMKQLGLLPIEMIDTLEQTEELIGFIDSYNADDFPFTDDDGNLLETMYAKLSAIKEAWKNQKAHAFEAFRNDPILADMPGGTVDTSDPKVLRPEEMKSERPIKFWRDLSEKVDYIEEK